MKASRVKPELSGDASLSGDFKQMHEEDCRFALCIQKVHLIVCYGQRKCSGVLFSFCC